MSRARDELYAQRRKEKGIVTAMEQATINSRRYRWLRKNPAWETEQFLSGLTPEQFDAEVDKAIANER
jgi:hypothetical protein